MGWEERERDGRGDGDGALINGRNCTSLTLPRCSAEEGIFFAGRIGGGDLVKVREGERNEMKEDAEMERYKCIDRRPLKSWWREGGEPHTFIYIEEK